MKEEAKSPGKTQRACVACREDIDAQASLCQKCGSYQNRWMNTAKFVATIAGAISLVFAAGAYIISTLPGIKRTLTWRSDPRIVAFESQRGVTVFNAGDGPLLLSHITINVRNVGTQTLPINRVVPPAEIMRHDWNPDMSKFASWALLGRAPAPRWQQAVAASGVGLDAPHHKCHGAIVYSVTDPSYLMYSQAHAQRLQYVEASAVLYYYDLRAGEGRADIPARALIFYNENCVAAPPSQR